MKISQVSSQNRTSYLIIQDGFLRCEDQTLCLSALGWAKHQLYLVSTFTRTVKTIVRACVEEVAIYSLLGG